MGVHALPHAACFGLGNGTTVRALTHHLMSMECACGSCMHAVQLSARAAGLNVA
jgi:hypothetical protein